MEKFALLHNPIDKTESHAGGVMALLITLLGAYNG